MHQLGKEKEVRDVCFVHLNFPPFFFLIIFESGSVRKCLWISPRIHAVPGFSLPLTSLALWLHGAESWNRILPSLDMFGWLTRLHKVIQAPAKGEDKQAAWERCSRAMDDLWWGTCKHAASRQPASDQQKAANPRIYKLSAAVSFLKLIKTTRV